MWVVILDCHCGQGLYSKHLRDSNPAQAQQFGFAKPLEAPAGAEHYLLLNIQSGPAIISKLDTLSQSRIHPLSSQLTPHTPQQIWGFFPPLGFEGHDRIDPLGGSVRTCFSQARRSVFGR